MGVINPNSSQPLQPIQGPQPTTPAQPAPPAQTTPAQPAPAAQSKDQSEAVQHKSADYSPVNDKPGAEAAKIEETMNQPQNLEALDKKLHDGDANDLNQVKSQMVMMVKNSLGQDKAMQFLSKLSSTTPVPDPENPGKTIPRGKLYERLMQNYLNEYKSAPPEKREAALHNLVHLLAGGAVKIIGDDEGC